MAPLGYSQPSAIPRSKSNPEPWWEKFVQIDRTDARRIPPGVGIVFLTVELPDSAPTLGAFILMNHAEKTVVVRARSSWDDDMNIVDREILLGTREMIESLFEAVGFEAGRAAVSEFSNTIRTSDEISLAHLDQPEATADQLSEQLFGQF